MTLNRTSIGLDRHGPTRPRTRENVAKVRGPEERQQGYLPTEGEKGCLFQKGSAEKKKKGGAAPKCVDQRMKTRTKPPSPSFGDVKLSRPSVNDAKL